MMTHTNEPHAVRKGLTTVSLLASILMLAVAATRAEAQTRAYVANSDADLVTVIDTSSNTLGTPIAVGSAPRHVVISKDATRVYVANTGSNTVSVIDTDKQQVVAIISLQDQPSSIAVTPKGDRLFVLGATGVLEVIDTTSDAVVASVALGGTNGRIAITPDGTRAYIAAGTVTVIDTATNEVLATIIPEVTAVPGVANFAVAVAITPDGTRAYVPFITYSTIGVFGFSAAGGVAVIDTATNKVTKSIDLFSLPGSITLTADGSRAFVSIDAFWAQTGYGAAFVPGQWVATIDTATDANLGFTDVGSRPAGLAVTPDRTSVYVSIPGTDSVAQIDAATRLVKEVIAVLGGPLDVTVTPDPLVKPRAFAIDAIDDSPATPVAALAGGIALANVLANDTLGGGPAAVGNVTLSFVSSTNPGVTLDAGTGAVWVTADTAVGSHSLTYQICESGNADNCDQAAVTVAVRAPYVIAATPDRATSPPGAIAIASVVANDTLNNAPAGLASVALSLISADTGVSLNRADGSVLIAEGTSTGDHSLTYRICEVASPANCDDGSVTVTVVRRGIHAENDSATAPRTGGVAIANVLANDTLGDATATAARVTLSRLSSTDPGLTLSASGSVSVARGTPAGAQTLVYQICEAASPDNCSVGAATVTVSPYVVSAVGESARASSKNAGTAIRNVLSNDSIGGAPATLANVKLSLVSVSPANNRIVLDPDGSVDILSKAPSGLFSLVYQICEIESPTNCARATAKIDLSGSGK
jgi:YVTN family beta-propeller protein